MLREIVSHVVHVHVKDARVGVGGEVVYVPSGEDEARVVECLGVLPRSGYGGVAAAASRVRCRRPGRVRRLRPGVGKPDRPDRGRDRCTAMTGGRVPAPLTPGDRDLLLGLLDLPTTAPSATSPDAPPPRLAEAQRAYARGFHRGLRPAVQILGRLPIGQGQPRHATMIRVGETGAPSVGQRRSRAPNDARTIRP
ncbi:hypothetical protein Acsp04_52150 [Actinomadura sp. NBRC 104425]|nr:hypothetical protein Acsp04_52150 [Actinomadura sp. NBRC 104425]